MAATFNWCEDNGAATGSPSRGTTRSQLASPPTDVSWKNVDDAKTSGGGTAYTASPVSAGSNSYTKYQYGQFSGTFNLISNCVWSARTAPSGALATGLTLKGTVTSTYATPATTTNAALTTNYTAAEVAIGSGLAVSFSTTGPQDAAPTATLAAAGFTQYLATQLQTTGSAAAGDMAAITTTLRYDES
jgi:hypothetical protein